MGQQLAASLVSQDDTNGDGSLSLSELQSALAGDSTSSTASSALSTAFAALDTNGDGELSTSELAAGLDQAAQAAGPPPAGGPHHGAPPGPPPGDGTSTADAASSTGTASGSTGSDTTATAASLDAMDAMDAMDATDATSTSTQTAEQQVAAALAGLLQQFASSGYASLAQTGAATASVAITA